MPLSRIQTEILKLLASHRNPESYVAGSTPLNREAPRYSGDIDVFHDREELVAQAAEADAAVLQEHGYTLQWQRRQPTICTVLVQRPGEETKLEWVVDSDFRFFPTRRDEMFGYVLHPVDLAMNKTMAAAGRREVRDLVDLVTIHQTILPLGPVIWAAVEKAPGFTPEGLIAEIHRNSSYSSVEWRALLTNEPLDPKAIIPQLREALEEAEAFVMKMPTDKAGLLFLKDGCVVQPDPDRLEDYHTHAGQRRGHWPSSAEISTAMLEHYKKPPTP
ncbi:MAG TPA: hypothetical protein VGZ73_04940 [Bryobacteraceae bacterium]|nr:hypothetical protein [Bryobacteraceae bacterium]